MAEINPRQSSSRADIIKHLERLVSRPSKTTIILFLTLFSIGFSLFIVKDFSMPISGGGDFDIWEYNGYYLSKNLSFNWFPHLNLFNNQVFYPYGVSSVYQNWSLERDFYYAALYSFFGVGPWLQFYYCASILITVLGAFLLIERNYGWQRASLFAALVTAFNFHAVYKFPVHLGYSTVHWVVLSIITDFLLVERVVSKNTISLKLLTAKFALLVLCLGHDIGYITGFALSSFTISFIYICGLFLYRNFKGEVRISSFLRGAAASFKTEFVSSRLPLLFLSITVAAAYFYIPLVLQIAKEATQFNFTGIYNGAWWDSPLRLLVPFFPFIPWPQLQLLLNDKPEFAWEGSVGWFLLFIAVAGLWQSRRQPGKFVPLLVLLTLCIFYHPIYFTAIKIFPWFTFFRSGGRSAVIYAVILCLFALEAAPYILRSRKSVVALLGGLALVEISTAYSLFGYQPYRFDNSFFPYMQRVKEQPGEAVLDWPFCTIGGNGIGSSTCPFYLRNASIYALSRFHGKKVMGEYFGRLHPDQVEPYNRAGWSFLFHPDKPFTHLANRQTRCFSADEWKFFDKFYKLNDFAGINLQTEVLPPGCAEQFHQRYGNPAAVTIMPWAGRVEFLAKPVALRDQVDSEAGINLQYTPASIKLLKDFSEVDLLKRQQIPGLLTTGLGAIEESSEGRLRRIIQPSMELSFGLGEARQLELQFRFMSPIGDRVVFLKINGREVANFGPISRNDVIERQIKFSATSGINKIVFGYRDKQSSLLGNWVSRFTNLVSRLYSKPETVDMSNKYWYRPQFQELSIVEAVPKVVSQQRFGKMSISAKS